MLEEAEPAYTAGFQSTHPARGATPSRCPSRLPRRYFNPRTPQGVRHDQPHDHGRRKQFQSTHPARGATDQPHDHGRRKQFQSTHPARGATYPKSDSLKHVFISIHAPRKGCDSTPSLSRAMILANFNPRTPQGVRLGGIHLQRRPQPISIHAPRKGCDDTIKALTGADEPFQSTHPARGATRTGISNRVRRSISIHAPRKGCDPGKDSKMKVINKFQSTHPARGATRRASASWPAAADFNPRTPQGVRLIKRGDNPGKERKISIHAPRKGCDVQWPSAKCQSLRFQSTHPARGATGRLPSCCRPAKIISIHAPRKGCDVADRQRAHLDPGISIHAPRKGCDWYGLSAQYLPH